MKKLFALMPLAMLLSASQPSPVTPVIPAVQALLEKNGCAACHNLSRKLVGPMWTDIAAKKYSAQRISALVKKPEPSNWPGYVPMLAQSTIPKAELNKIATWLSALK
jgi:cytochrome c551/c552